MNAAAHVCPYCWGPLAAVERTYSTDWRCDKCGFVGDAARNGHALVEFFKNDEKLNFTALIPFWMLRSDGTNKHEVLGRFKWKRLRI